jgi:hypothetical protein
MIVTNRLLLPNSFAPVNLRLCWAFCATGVFPLSFHGDLALNFKWRNECDYFWGVCWLSPSLFRLPHREQLLREPMAPQPKQPQIRPRKIPMPLQSQMLPLNPQRRRA